MSIHREQKSILFIDSCLFNLAVLLVDVRDVTFCCARFMKLTVGGAVVLPFHFTRLRVKI